MVLSIIELEGENKNELVAKTNTVFSLGFSMFFAVVFSLFTPSNSL